jgi:hypothetical protein
MVKLHDPATFSRGKEPWYPFSRRSGRPHSWSGDVGEEKNIVPYLDSNPSPSSQYPSQ